MQPLDIIRRVARPSASAATAASQSAARATVSATPAAYVFDRDPDGVMGTYAGDLLTSYTAVQPGDIVKDNKNYFAGTVIAIHFGSIIAIGDDESEPVIFSFYTDGTYVVFRIADADYTPTTAQLDALKARVKALEDARDVIEDSIDGLTRDLDETNHDLALNYLTKSSASSTYLTKSSASSTYLTKTAASSTYLPLTGGTLTGDLTIRKAYPQIVLQQTGGKGVRISTGSGGESFILNTLAGGYVPLTVYTVNFQDQAWLEYSTTAGRFTFTKPVKATIV